MKTVFNKKNLMIMKNYNKYICAFVLLLGMSVNAWGAVDDVHTLIDFTQTGNLGHTSYTDDWTIAANTSSSGNVACDVHHAVSNAQDFICFGGKPSAADSYIGTAAPTTYPTKAFTINVLKLANKGHLTIHSVKLFVYSTYSDGDYSDKIDEAVPLDLVSRVLISLSEG